MTAPSTSIPFSSTTPTAAFATHRQELFDDVLHLYQELQQFSAHLSASPWLLEDALPYLELLAQRHIQAQQRLLALTAVSLQPPQDFFARLGAASLLGDCPAPLLQMPVPLQSLLDAFSQRTAQATEQPEQPAQTPQTPQTEQEQPEQTKPARPTTDTDASNSVPISMPVAASAEPSEAVSAPAPPQAQDAPPNAPPKALQRGSPILAALPALPAQTPPRAPHKTAKPFKTSKPPESKAIEPKAPAPPVEQSEKPEKPEASEKTDELVVKPEIFPYDWRHHQFLDEFTDVRIQQKAQELIELYEPLVEGFADFSDGENELSAFASEEASFDLLWQEECMKTLMKNPKQWYVFPFKQRSLFVVYILARFLYANSFINAANSAATSSNHAVLKHRSESIRKSIYKIADSINALDVYKDLYSKRTDVDFLWKTVTQLQEFFAHVVKKYEESLLSAYKYINSNKKTVQKNTHESAPSARDTHDALDAPAEPTSGTQVSHPVSHPSSHPSAGLSSSDGSSEAPSELLPDALAQKLKGKSAILIGGDKREQSRATLEEYFGFSSLEWLDPVGDRRVDAVASRILKKTYDVVIIINSFSSHNTTGKIRLAAQKACVLYVSVGKGYGAVKIVQAMREQWHIA